MNYTASEVKSGVLILVSIIILLGLTFVVGGITAGETNAWKIRFGYIAGLETGSPVYYAGKEVGKVSKINVDYTQEKPIQVTAKMAKHIVLRENSEAFIDTLGMMGEKFVELTPGTITSPERSVDAVIDGVDPVSMHELFTKMNSLSDNMVEMSESLNPVAKQLATIFEGNGENFQEIIENVADLTGSLDTMLVDNKADITNMIQKISAAMDSVDFVLTENKEDIAKMVINFHETSVNVRDMTHDLKFRPWRLLRKE